MKRANKIFVDWRGKQEFLRKSNGIRNDLRVLFFVHSSQGLAGWKGSGSSCTLRNPRQTSVRSSQPCWPSATERNGGLLGSAGKSPEFPLRPWETQQSVRNSLAPDSKRDTEVSRENHSPESRAVFWDVPHHPTCVCPVGSVPVDWDSICENDKRFYNCDYDILYGKWRKCEDGIRGLISWLCVNPEGDYPGWGGL